jgi:sugar (pentulose or hexulose) kinase
MRFNLYSAVSTLKVGLDILLKEEQVKVDKLFGHGGFFKTPEVGQKIMSAATGGPVTVMETAGEGGAWGIAVLALFLMKKEGRSLSEFLNEVIFAGEEGVEITASQEEIDGFDSFMKTFNATLPIEKAAVETL